MRRHLLHGGSIPPISTNTINKTKLPFSGRFCLCFPIWHPSPYPSYWFQTAPYEIKEINHTPPRRAWRERVPHPEWSQDNWCRSRAPQERGSPRPSINSGYLLIWTSSPQVCPSISHHAQSLSRDRWRMLQSTLFVRYGLWYKRRTFSYWWVCGPSEHSRHLYSSRDGRAFACSILLAGIWQSPQPPYPPWIQWGLYHRLCGKDMWRNLISTNTASRGVFICKIQTRVIMD